METISLDLLELLACPNCAGNLDLVQERIICAVCKCSFDLSNGIPYLYPDDIDSYKMDEEGNLAEMMNLPIHSRGEKNKLNQWVYSKQEFWDIFRKKMFDKPTAMINIGCGFDAHFQEFQDKGILFVNFDLVPNALQTLKNDYNAKYCVAGNINNIPFKKSQFDAVICVDVLHHLGDNLLYYLQTLRELLKPQGMLFIEDPNAWGLYQIPKSILLPKPIHRSLRTLYHKLRQSTHRPAEYEFPIDIYLMVDLLKNNGFGEIEIHENFAYPNSNIYLVKLYQFLAMRNKRIAQFHNYHYLVTARNA